MTIARTSDTAGSNGAADSTGSNGRAGAAASHGRAGAGGSHGTAGGGDAAAVLTGMYAAEAKYLAAGGPGRASFDILAPYFAPDVVLHQADALPYGGTWCGHDGLTRFFLMMSQVWESFAMVEQDFLATGATSVVRTRVRARARATGRELSFPILQTLRIEDGRIVEVRPFYWDTAAIAEACGSPSR